MNKLEMTVQITPEENKQLALLSAALEKDKKTVASELLSKALSIIRENIEIEMAFNN